jgi:uncharacterized membrane protein YgcG
LLSPDQLNNLVAPVALYPDPVLSTVLAASTYPLEIVEAQQWLQQNGNLKGAPLMDAAKQQDWDPSVQALVAFPDALRLLSNDIRWTTGLGNAFLAQQADVMSAVQGMRARARANGKLTTTPQQVVTMANQDGQSAIEIQPADPQVVYVPVYQPAYVWGPPAWGAYPDLWYPEGFGFGLGFGPGIFIGGLFPGWGGWGGWGWGCGWFGQGLIVNGGFFHRYGFRGGIMGRGFGGRGIWAHQPSHRMGVPYPNRTVASRFNSNRFSGSGMNRGQFSGGNRTAGAGANGSRSAPAGGWRSFNGNRTATNSFQSSNRQASPNYGARGGSQGYRAPAQGYRGYSAASSYRSAPAFNRSSGHAYSAPRAQSFSAPRSFSAPHFSGGGGGHSGFSGGHSGGGGGHSGGGGRHR